MPKGVAASCFHFHKNKFAPLSGHDINFFMSKASVTIKNFVAEFFEMLTRQGFTFSTQALVRRERTTEGISANAVGELPPPLFLAPPCRLAQLTLFHQ